MLHGNKSFDNVVANIARVQDFAPPLLKFQGCKNKASQQKQQNNFKISNNHTMPWKHMET
jgi:hypothetical protein